MANNKFFIINVVITKKNKDNVTKQTVLRLREGVSLTRDRSRLTLRLKMLVEHIRFTLHFCIFPFRDLHFPFRTENSKPHEPYKTDY